MSVSLYVDRYVQQAAQNSDSAINLAFLLHWDLRLGQGQDSEASVFPACAGAEVKVYQSNYNKTTQRQTQQEINVTEVAGELKKLNVNGDVISQVNWKIV